MRRPLQAIPTHWHSMWPAVRTRRPKPFVSALVVLTMVAAEEVAVVAVAAVAKYLIRNLAVNVAAKSLAKDPYLCCSDCVVDTIEVKLILGRRQQRLQHSDYCRTFVNAVWRAQRMPLHLGQRVATTNYHRTVGTAHSCAVRGAMHQLDLCKFNEKKSIWQWLAHKCIILCKATDDGIVCRMRNEKKKWKNKTEISLTRTCQNRMNRESPSQMGSNRFSIWWSVGFDRLLPPWIPWPGTRMSCALSLAARSVWLGSSDQILIALNEYVAGTDALNWEQPGNKRNDIFSIWRYTRWTMELHWGWWAQNFDRNVHSFQNGAAFAIKMPNAKIHFPLEPASNILLLFTFYFSQFPGCAAYFIHLRDRFAHFRCTKRKSCHIQDSLSRFVSSRLESNIIRPIYFYFLQLVPG